MTEFERNLGARWFNEVWNKKRREAIAEMLTPDAILHDGANDSVGPEGFYPFFDRLNASLSEIQVTICDTFADGDRICVRWRCNARHTGDGLGVASTGKPIEVTGMSIMRVANGQLVEGWQNWDMLGLIQQLQASESMPHLYVGRAAGA